MRLIGSRPTALVAILSLAVVLVLAVVACAGGSSTPTPTPTTATTAATAATPGATTTPTAAVTPGVAAFPIASIPVTSPMITGAQVCTDLAAFQASLDVLTGLDLESVGVRDAIGAIQAAVTSGLAFVESAKAAFGPEAKALGTALAGLQSALQGLTGEGSLGDKAATIENAIDEVAAAFDTLKAEVAPGCPAPEASGS